MRKWHFGDVMSCDFGSKNGQHSNVFEMQDFKVKRNQRTPKDANLHALQNGYLKFSKFLFFDPQKLKLRFFKNNAKKSKICIDIQKTGIYIKELCATSMCAKFQANIFIFGCNGLETK